MVIRSNFIRRIFNTCCSKKLPLCTSSSHGTTLMNNIGCSTIQGRSKLNEDKFNYKYIDTDTIYLGVFDGHNGDFVSNFSNINLPLILQNNFTGIAGNKLYDQSQMFSSVNNILLKSFDECQNLIKETITSVEKSHCHNMVGSTAVVSILKNNKFLTIANVGDSKAILCRDSKPVELSTEHNPENKEEVKRIKEFGGEIDWDSRFKPMVNSRLSMTRSFGNLLLKPTGVISEPTIRNIVLDDAKDSFIVLCTDGITDAMNNDDIVFIISQHDKPMDAADDLVSTAQQYGSTDDCTALVVLLPAWRRFQVNSHHAGSMFRTLTGHRSNG